MDSQQSTGCKSNVLEGEPGLNRTLRLGELGQPEAEGDNVRL